MTAVQYCSVMSDEKLQLFNNRLKKRQLICGYNIVIFCELKIIFCILVMITIYPLHFHAIYTCICHCRN